MRLEDLTSLLRRRKLFFAVTLLLAVSAVIVGTLLLPETYRATATLFVGESSQDQTVLDTTQGEQLSRTYTALAATPSVADAVLGGLSSDLTRDELLDRMSFAPIERTQLLQVSAEAENPAEAAEIANVYSTVFIDRSDELATAGRAPSTVAVSAPAVQPEDSASPNVPLLIGLGTLLAIATAFAAALLRDRLDRRLQIPEDAETFEGQPIIGRVPKTEGLTSIANPQDNRTMVDALRVLRTNLELTEGHPATTILITSPAQGDGKSTIAASLAVALAHDGERVTLVECDLRRPTLDLSAAGDGFTTTGPGLASYLGGVSDLRKVLRVDPSLPNLLVVYAGSIGVDPGGLLRSPKLGELLAARHSLGDWVILDTPPVAVGDDALMLTPQVDGVIVVLDEGRASMPAFRAGVNQLKQVGAKLLGVVINRASVTSGSSSYYYSPPGRSPSADIMDERPEAEALRNAGRSG